MAYAGTVIYSYHGTAGTVADTVTFSRKANALRILNTGSADIYITLGKEGAAAAAPVVAADNTYLVRAGSSLDEASENFVTSIKLICASSSTYSVEAHH